jgi:Fe-S cluster assembly ATP-binding protein
MNKLKIENLHVEVEGKKILKGLNLELETGKVNALMGPNGSGKSTLVNALMGHPKYIVTKGKIIFNEIDITKFSPDKRAKLGIFLSFQYPREIEGIEIRKFLRQSLNSLKEEKISFSKFQKLLDEKIKELEIKEEFLKRYLNKGFSGGEKKKMEILQMLMFDPELILLDETDSGLDIDAIKIISKGVNKVMNEKKTALIITHYKRILEYIKPDKVFIMIDGKIVLEGSDEILNYLEEKGYGWIENE